jgi:hypothetical protein
MTVKGIDVSGYQSATFSTSGLGFAFIKATEGTSYINPRMTAQAAHARAAGLVVGFYHFLWPGNIQAQAEYFVEKCASIEGDILALDWETTGSGTRATGAEKDAFIAAVKKLRPTHRVVLYCNRDFWLNHDTTSNAGDGLWIADYVTAAKPRVESPWLFHQYTSTPVDTNVGQFADKAALKAWAGGSAPVTPAPVKPTKPATPKVDLSNVIAAAKADPKGKQGHATHPADVKLVEAALKAEGLLAAKYAADGSFGTTTVAAYAKWQRSKAGGGYTGKAADGIPGKASLTALGKRHGFTVVA